MSTVFIQLQLQLIISRRLILKAMYDSLCVSSFFFRETPRVTQMFSSDGSRILYKLFISFVWENLQTTKESHLVRSRNNCEGTHKRATDSQINNMAYESTLKGEAQRNDAIHDTDDTIKENHP